MTNGVDYPDTTSEDAFGADPLRPWRSVGARRWCEAAATGELEVRLPAAASPIVRLLTTEERDRAVTVPEPAACGACAFLGLAALRAVVRRVGSG